MCTLPRYRLSWGVEQSVLNARGAQSLGGLLVLSVQQILRLFQIPNRASRISQKFQFANNFIKRTFLLQCKQSFQLNQCCFCLTTTTNQVRFHYFILFLFNLSAWVLLSSWFGSFVFNCYTHFDDNSYIKDQISDTFQQSLI